MRDRGVGGRAKMRRGKTGKKILTKDCDDEDGQKEVLLRHTTARWEGRGTFEDLKKKMKNHN